MSDTLYIVMPAYNEADNIESVVQQWHPIVEKLNNGSRLVIFNDGSRDGTYEKMISLSERYPLFIPQTKPNSGHGATCLHAYRYAIEQGADYIFQTDSDGQTEPAEFWSFWENRNSYDILIGERKSREDGFQRVLVTKVLKMVIKVFFNVWVSDANTPFRLMKREHLKEYLHLIPVDFFLSNVLMTTIAVKKKQKIYWKSITFKPRQKGINSINMKRIFKIGVQAMKDFRQLNKQLMNLPVE